MDRFARIIRHRWSDASDVRRALPPEAMARLASHVSASERGHSGEIRICIEAGLPWSYLWQRLSARARALTMFGKLRVWDTERNNGVLIYLLLAERTIEIVADRGFNGCATASDWSSIITEMAPDLNSGRFEQGVIRAVDRVDRLLRAHFPRRPDADDVNELPDTPTVV